MSGDAFKVNCRLQITRENVLKEEVESHSMLTWKTGAFRVGAPTQIKWPSSFKDNDCVQSAGYS